MNNFECVRRAHKVGKQRTVARGKIFSQFCGPSLPLISFVYLKNVTTHKIQQSETATSWGFRSHVYRQGSLKHSAKLCIIIENLDCKNN